jgi:hypothetical protein
VIQLQEYDIKRKLKSATSLESIAEAMRSEFGGAEEKSGHLVTSFGAIIRLECWISEKGKLCVETESNKSASNESASDTIARYNRFLEKTTGMTSKERRKKAVKVK